jgi:FkbM family methyltransferase
MSPWLPPKLKTVVKMSTDKRLRRITAEISRLRRLPPRVATITTLLGKEFEMVDAPSFLCTYESLFEKQIYRFASAKSCPVILDCGANTGVSVVYFKHLFPDCRVTAFEPDPRIFEALRRNVMERFQFEDVTLIPKAVWDKEAVIPFIADGAVSGRIEPNRTGIPSSEIGTVRLREFLLREEIDLLKLDIEGAETAVLEDCAQSLTGVRNLFVEYHSYASKPQTLHRIISVLSAANFRLHIHPELASPQPFFVRNIYSGMDHQLNIFAFR